jgi:hypothetical protein
MIQTGAPGLWNSSVFSFRDIITADYADSTDTETFYITYQVIDKTVIDLSQNQVQQWVPKKYAIKQMLDSSMTD